MKNNEDVIPYVSGYKAKDGKLYQTIEEAISVNSHLEDLSNYRYYIHMVNTLTTKHYSDRLYNKENRTELNLLIDSLLKIRLLREKWEK